MRIVNNPNAINRATFSIFRGRGGTVKMLKVTIEIRQTLLSKLLLGIASVLYFYKLVNYQLYLQIIDMAILDIKAFNYRIGNGKWRTLKVGDGM